jgi:hypothetical protein
MGKDCVDGQCRGACTSTTQCPPNHACQIGYCTPMDPDTGSGKACQANCDCPSGERCVEGFCRL